MKPGSIVSLAKEITDGRYGVDRQVRLGQIGIVQPGNRRGWIAVEWYHQCDEAPQLHQVHELQLIKRG